MRKKDFHTKKFIAIVMILTLCILSLYQGYVEKKVPVEFVGLAGFVVGTYFKGSPTAESEKESE